MTIDTYEMTLYYCFYSILFECISIWESEDAAQPMFVRKHLLHQLHWRGT